MRKAKRLISYILSLILVIFVSAVILLLNMNSTILSTSNFKKKITDADYYSEMYNIIVDSCNNYRMQSGFEEQILNNVISKEDVKQDINGLIDYIYEGRAYNIDTSKIISNLDRNIESYIAENNYEVSDENKQSIDEFKKVIEDSYKKNLEYSNETIKTISEYFKVAKTVARIAIMVLIILSAILILIIFRLNKPSIGIVMLATGGLFMVLKCYSGVSVAVNNILVLNRALSNTIISMANQLLQNVFVIGVVLCVFGIAWILFFEIRRKLKRILLLEEHSQVIR